MLRTLTVLSFVLAAGLGQGPAVGDKVADAAFPPFANGDGRQSMSEFFGQPVVIDQWGINCPPCIGMAVPTAIRHDHELRSEGLVTILVESQGHDDRTLAAFLWKRFPDNGCFSCGGGSAPIPHSNGIPHCAVIGVDGTILWSGNPAVEPKKVEDFVAQELEKVKKGWGDTPAVRKVRAVLYGKGDLAGAMALAEELTQGEELTMLQKEIDARWQSSVRAIGTLKQQGRYVRAQQRALQLQKAAGERADWKDLAKSEVAAFEQPETKALLDLDKKIEKAEKQLRDKKDEQAEKALAALTKELEDSAVATRARELLAALRTKVE